MNSPGILGSPGLGAPADPCSRETVLSMLKESRKREVDKEDDRSFTAGQKGKRRYVTTTGCNAFIYNILFFSHLSVSLGIVWLLKTVYNVHLLFVHLGAMTAVGVLTRHLSHCCPMELLHSWCPSECEQCQYKTFFSVIQVLILHLNATLLSFSV